MQVSFLELMITQQLFFLQSISDSAI